MVLMWKRAFSGIKNAVMINQVPVRCNWGEGIFRIVWIRLTSGKPPQ